MQVGIWSSGTPLFLLHAIFGFDWYTPSVVHWLSGHLPYHFVLCWHGYGGRGCGGGGGPGGGG